MKIRTGIVVGVNPKQVQLGVQFRAREGIRTAWLVVLKCSCGDVRIARIGSAIRGSGCILCGADSQKVKRPHTQKHGMIGTKTYYAWASMKERCTNHNHKAFKHYGGRGISFCERWSDFSLFFEDMGVAPDVMQLERKNNNEGYCKENCVWASVRDQRRNTRQTVKITFNGETLCMSDWAERLGIAKHNLQRRMQSMSFEEAISLPVTKYKERLNNGSKTSG